MSQYQIFTQDGMRRLNRLIIQKRQKQRGFKIYILEASIYGGERALPFMVSLLPSAIEPQWIHGFKFFAKTVLFGMHVGCRFSRGVSFVLV